MEPPEVYQSGPKGFGAARGRRRRPGRQLQQRRSSWHVIPKTTRTLWVCELFECAPFQLGLKHNPRKPCILGATIALAHACMARGVPPTDKLLPTFTCAMVTPLGGVLTMGTSFGWLNGKVRRHRPVLAPNSLSAWPFLLPAHCSELSFGNTSFCHTKRVL